MTGKPLFGPAGNSLSFTEEGNRHTYQSMKWLSERHLDAYEYSGGNGITGGEATFRKIGEEAQKYDIKLSLHAPYYISLSGVELETRLKSIGYIKKSLAAAEAMGADTIVIHTGSAAKITRETAMDFAKDTLYKTLAETEGSPVRLGLETMGKINQLGTLEEVIELCKMDSRLAPVVDFGHMNARNRGGLFTSRDDYKAVFDKIATELGDLHAMNLHCHFSKIEYTAAGEKKHLTNSDNTFGPPFEPLMEAVFSEGLSPRIICESDGTMAEDALEMKRYYAGLNNRSNEEI